MFFLTTFWEKLVHWDQRMFVHLNSDWINPFFDAIMPYMRSPVYWTPVYLFLLVFAIMNFRLKGLWWILLLISTVALCDMTGTYMFKHLFHRIRPCNEPDLVFQVRLLLKDCPRGYSFVSNHAANHFGMAMFIAVTFRPLFRNWTLLAFFWAALICYAQVYVGLHFPLDVMVGALIGLFWGYLIGYAFNNRFGFAIFDHQPVE